MAPTGERRSTVSVSQFTEDPEAVTRGLRDGWIYTLTVDGEPLAEIVPARRWRGVSREDALAAFADAPVLDPGELREDLDAFLDDDLGDPYEGTGL
ncbi:hypothetical protein I6A60_11110 [Frankia sp. AgB1.9]|uniref:hypothetical protein n=1 Tax=unclassified Frankia TaxID=2632575 RepID=UPI0019313EA4|nr:MULTISPECIES: hypothetical protein [unclassified Frankia]MBL7492009.1 hypothetical protein [Frankia sp. AgW1.1]MBL7548418.1 hypothetical protein [Frankia sp. AgB1.9]